MADNALLLAQAERERRRRQAAQASAQPAAAPEESNALADFAKGAYAGLLNLTAPGGDMIAALDPRPGRQTAARGEVPNNMAGQMGNLGAQAALIAPAMGAGLGLVGAAGEAATMGNALRNFANTASSTFRASPLKATAIEGGLGMTAGAGGQAASELAPDSEAARFIGEFLGGVTPGALASTPSLIYRGARATPFAGAPIRAAEGIAEGVRSLMPSSSMRRAQGRFERASPDLEGAAARMDEPLLPGLTPAAKTGDEGLMRLEAAVDSSLPDAEQFVKRSMDGATNAIRSAFQEFKGDPQKSAQVFERAQRELTQSLDDRIRLAAGELQKALTRMRPGTTREQINRVARASLNKAYDDARAQERALYDLIPMDTIVPTNNAVNAFQSLRAGLGKAQLEDMPKEAQALLARGSGNFLGPQTTILEMRALQSKLRQTARNSRSGDNANLNRARIADALADAISVDIQNAAGDEGVSDLVKAATSFSRELNQKFRNGTVGDLLGLSGQAELRVPEGLTLEASIGVSGPRAREAFDDIVKATNDPAVMAAMSDYVRSRFLDAAVDLSGNFSRPKAETFIKQNAEILKRMPGIEKEIFDALAKNDAIALREAQRARVNTTSPSVSKATMFIQRDPSKAFDAVLASKTPGRDMRNLLNMAKRDDTGEAVAGLKSAFANYIYDNSLKSGNISGQKMAELFDSESGKQALRAIYTPDEMRRLEAIKNTALRLDMQRSARPSSEGVLGDQPGQMATVLARMLGAAWGSRIARNTGTGGIQMQAIMSDRMKKMLDAGLDPARKLIEDAVQDEALFKNLLMAKVRPDGKISKQAERRLNAWILANSPSEEE